MDATTTRCSPRRPSTRKATSNWHCPTRPRCCTWTAAAWPDDSLCSTGASDSVGADRQTVGAAFAATTNPKATSTCIASCLEATNWGPICSIQRSSVRFVMESIYSVIRQAARLPFLRGSRQCTRRLQSDQDRAWVPLLTEYLLATIMSRRIPCHGDAPSPEGCN